MYIFIVSLHFHTLYIFAAMINSNVSGDCFGIDFIHPREKSLVTGVVSILQIVYFTTTLQRYIHLHTCSYICIYSSFITSSYIVYICSKDLNFVLHIARHVYFLDFPIVFFEMEPKCTTFSGTQPWHNRSAGM